MNNISHPFFYPTLLLAIAVGNTYAEPVAVRRAPAAGVFVHAGLSTTDSITDITQSSLSDAASLAVGTTFSNAHKPFATGDSALSLLTASTGKVVSIEGLAAADQIEGRQTTFSDINSTDSVGTPSETTGSTGTASGDQVVSEASAVVSGIVDPGAMTIATTSGPASSAASVASGPNFNADPVSGNPEPSTLLLAGSMFAGLAMFKFSRAMNG